MKLQYIIIQNIITEESAKRGDYESSEIIKEREEDLRSLISECQKYGIVGRSKNDRTPWFESVDPDINYQTGEESYYSLHLKGTSEKHFDRINKILNN